MKMTFDDYIQNPMGRENSVISNRNMYRELYTEKFNKILLREGGKISYNLYTDGKRYFCYIKIPSEVVHKFYYDVLVEFDPPAGVLSGNNLNRYNVKFYSNDPAFVFTFAHAFIKNGIFITDLTDKMSKEAVKTKAKEKNPKDIVGYVKSLYFAYIFMNRRGLFNKLHYVDRYDLKYLKRAIMNADEKIQLRQEAGSHVAKNNKRDREAIKKVRSPQNTLPLDTPIQHKPNIGKTKSVGKISKVKSINKITKKRK